MGISGQRAAVLAALITLLLAGPAPRVHAVEQPTGDATATVETEPVVSIGDAADDPAIWRHPTDPSRSVVIGNDKGGALEVYDLEGRKVQRIAEGFFGNVDVRGDLVVTYRLGIRVYRIDPSTRLLANVTDTASGSISVGFSGEGLCLHRDAATGMLSAFANARSGRMVQFALEDADADGLIEGTKLRDWDVGTEVEGCVADDELGQLYVSEEEVGIWRYGTAPEAPTDATSRMLVDGLEATGGHLRPDVEGLTIVYQPNGAGYLIASSQSGSNTLNAYMVYERQAPNAYVRSFKVVAGATTDNCGWTDGIDALAADLGPAFPRGVFVCQDNHNLAPKPGNQNFKLVPLERVVGLVSGPPPPPPPPAVISFVGQASSFRNAVSHSLVTPASVQPGDGLVLLYASNTTATITGPVGWSSLGAVARSSSRAQVWRRVAAAGDAGSTVRVDVSGISKGSLVLLAYRGTSGMDPVAAFAGVPETTSTTTHLTPLMNLDQPRVIISIWTHKDSLTTALTMPAGVTARAAGTHTGSGRMTVLIADSGGNAPVGPTGGLASTAATATNNATMWTIALASA